MIEFKVHRFSAPANTFSGSPELWRIVTGALPEAAASIRLVDNGFRAAVGQESDRAPLRTWLEALPGVKSVFDTATPDASRLVDLDLGECPRHLTVFFYNGKGALRGLDFREGKVRFKVAFELRSVTLREVLLELVPEIEEPPGPPKWVITPEGAKQVPEQRRHPFEELAFSALVPDGGFLLLGPTPAVYDKPLLGRPFFVETPEGEGTAEFEKRESIYIISPLVRAHTQGAPPRSDAAEPALGASWK